MSSLDVLLPQLGEEIQDASEETFLLFSQDFPSQNLGMINDRAPTLDLAINNRDLIIKQSPSVLNSTREGGTTGAVVWKVTPLFTEWLASPSNLLFESHVLSSDSLVLELGAGIAGIVPAMLAPMVQKYIATDQTYALKLLKENIDANSVTHVGPRTPKTPRRVKVEQARNVDVLPLDWETDDVESLLKANAATEGVDLLVACDCIYNYALIEPFVQTCVDVCKLRRKVGDGAKIETVVVVAQQLRQPDVFEEWLEMFGRAFRTWRLPDDVLTEGLKEGSGFVVHLGVLKE